MSALDRAVRRAFRDVMLSAIKTTEFQAALAAAMAAEKAREAEMPPAPRPEPPVLRAILRDAATLDARKAEANRKRSETQKRHAEARRAARAQAEPPPDTGADKAAPAPPSPVVAHSVVADRFEPFPGDLAEVRQHIRDGKRARWISAEYGWPLQYAQTVCAEVDAEQKAAVATSLRDVRA